MTGQPIPIWNIFYLLCYAWGHVQERDVVRVAEIAKFDRIDNLLGKVLAEGTFRLFRGGIDRGYREIQKDYSGVRGKIAVGDTVKRALRSRSQVACVFEELTGDVLHNQILYATLKSLLRLDTLHRDVRREVRAAFGKFSGITEIRLNRKHFDQVQLDRNRRYYRFLLSVCRLIHEQILVDQASGETRFLGFSEEKMWKLYEDFLIGFYKREQKSYSVNESRVIKWVDEGTSDLGRQTIPLMEADIILEGLGRRIIMDAKYTAEALKGKLGGKPNLRSPHLYQLLAYLRNREATTNAGAMHEGILLYPTVNETVHVDVCLEGFSIQARSIDLSQEWAKIRDDLLALVGVT